MGGPPRSLVSRVAKGYAHCGKEVVVMADDGTMNGGGRGRFRSYKASGAA